MPKTELRQLIRHDAIERGRSWVLGGPHGWAKGELITYLVYETDLVQR